MPQKVVEEWAEFLDDEKIISIEYRFATAILTERKADAKEQKNQKKDFQRKKDTIVRQVESTKAYLDREVNKINKFKYNLEEIKREIEKEFGSGSAEFRKLQEYEKLKQALMQDLEKQKISATEKIGELDQKITREQNKFDQLVKRMNLSKALVAKEKSDEIEIKEQENQIQQKLEDINKSIKAIENDIKYERKIHSIEKDIKGFFSRLKGRYQQFKDKKEVNRKEKYYGLMHDKSKVDIFNNIANDLRVSLLKRDLNQSEEYFKDLKMCFNSIDKSDIDQETKKICYNKMFEMYNSLKNLYKNNSYEDNKRFIEERIDETQNKVDSIKENYYNLQDSLKEKDEKIALSKQYITKFEGYIKKFQTDINATKKNLDTLIKKKTMLDKRVADMENRVMNKVLEKRGKFEDSIQTNENVKRYQKLFDKKAELERLIAKINHDKQNLENQIRLLIKKAKSMEISQSKNMDHEISEIQTLMNDVEVRKKEFEEEVRYFNQAIAD